MANMTFGVNIIPKDNTVSLGTSQNKWKINGVDDPKLTDTDTKVTAVGNHYTPAEDTSAKLSADASSSTAAIWNSTSLVTGIDIKRDAKGHVVGVAVDSIKMPANPNSDTHRAIQVNGTQALGSNTTALNLKAGSNITITDGGSGAITIAATDTKYTAATAAPGNIATSGSQGSSTNYARQDHTHGISLATGDSNGQVKIAGSNVSVKGLGSAAYTNSTAYAVNSELTNQNLNTVTAPGFYNAGGANTCTNKPSGVDSFGMVVVHSAGGTYYTQMVYSSGGTIWRRINSNGTWSDWQEEIGQVVLVTDFNDFIPDNEVNVHWKYLRTYNGNASNAPISGDNITFYGWVMGSRDYCMQCVYVVYADTASNRGRQFVRCRVNGTWQSWIEVTNRVSKSGDVMTGFLYMPSASGVYSMNYDPMLYFLRDENSVGGNKLGAIFMNRTTVNNKYVASRMFFRHYSHDASGDSIEKWDQYQLPAVEEGLSSSTTYNILTSKSPVTIEQGGTGATSAPAAKANLGLGSAAMDFSVTNFQGATQHWGIGCVVQASSSATKTYLGKKTNLIALDDGLFMYNSTDSAAIWTLNVPVKVTQGGTGATTPAQARTNLEITPANIGAATTSHTHTCNIAADNGTNALTLAASTKYKLTAGDSTFIFTTPPNTTYTFTAGTSALAWNSEVTLATVGGLAVKAKLPENPVNALDVSAVGGATGNYISKISETDGKISATVSTTSVSNTWENGTTAGPTIKTTVNGVAGTAVAIPSATSTQSGVVTTGTQTFTGEKYFNVPNFLYIRSAGNTVWPGISFGSVETTGDSYTTINQAVWNILYTQFAGKKNSDNTYYQNRFFFRSYSDNGAGARVDKYEDYYLPQVNRNRTTNSQYNILTTKDMSFSITGNAANVTGTVEIAHGGTGASESYAACHNLMATPYLYLSNATAGDRTALKTQLNKLSTGYSATFGANSTAIYLMSNQKLNSDHTYGIVTKTADSKWQIFAFLGGSMYTWAITNITASATTITNFYKYTGTVQ